LLGLGLAPLFRKRFFEAVHLLASCPLFTNGSAGDGGAAASVGTLGQRFRGVLSDFFCSRDFMNAFMSFVAFLQLRYDGKAAKYSKKVGTKAHNVFFFDAAVLTLT
jgi:hypothetical protein